MAETINIPKVGPVKKTYVYVGVAAAAGVLGYAYWRNAQAVDVVTDVGTGDGTGEDFAPGGGAGGLGDGFGGSAGGSDSVVGDVIATNAQWYEKAYEATVNAGWDPQTVATALGNYLDHKPLTAQEQTIVRAGLAAAGTPPTGGPYTIITAQDPAPSIPTAPTGVKVVARGEDWLDLAWAPVAGASGYYVYVATSAGHSGKSGKVSGTSYRKTGLTHTKNYVITVTAVNADGKEGPQSAPIQGTTRGNEYPPVNFRVLDIGRTTAKVGWNGQLAATGYNIYRNGKKIGRHLGTFHPDSGLRPNTVYRYQVTSIGHDGKESAKSKTVTLRTKK